MEEVAAVSNGSKWFQVYVWRDKGLLKDMILRAAAAGFEVLCITVDAAMLGRRERDVRRGFTLPPKMGLDILVEGMIRPSWSLRFAFSEPISFANVAGNTDIDGSTAVDLAAFMNQQFDPTLSWDDVEWMRSLWDGPVLIKGVQSVADAVIARDRGLDGIVLSNHGGRQLDGAPAIIDLVQPAAEAVGGDLDIVCDGGVPARRRHRQGAGPRSDVVHDRTAIPVRTGCGGRGRRGLGHRASAHEHEARHGPVRRGERVRTDSGSDLPGRFWAVSRFATAARPDPLENPYCLG